MTVPSSPTPHAVPPAPQSAGAILPAFRHRAFTVVWIATVVANMGTWMYTAASGWLMTTLHVSALWVSLVQVAANLPIFLFAIPSGAFADIFDKRRFLIVGEVANTVLAAAFAVIVWQGWATPVTLLAFTFLIGAGAAVTAPAWQAIVPLLVPRQHLPGAVAANSAGINVSRALGPALGGAITAAFGLVAPFWINAVSNLSVIFALFWWRPPARDPRRLPPERFMGAMSAGLRHARHNPFLGATLARALAFFPFASAYWALLPLVARQRIAGGPEVYGLLLGAVGAGAVGGALVLRRVRARLGPDRTMASGTLGTGLALLLFALARSTPVALGASLIAGVSWIAVLSTLNISAQVALPEWVRARGLSVFVTVMFGATTLGSAFWGHVADLAGLPAALLAAAVGAVITIPLSWRWKLQTGADVDLLPSMHWPPPITSRALDEDEGPVLVTVDYRIDPDDRAAFLKALFVLSRERRRDGGFAWGVFEDMAEPGRYLETFQNETWLAHLRQHERVTHADQAVQRRVDAFQKAGAPITAHYVAAHLDKHAPRRRQRKARAAPSGRSRD